MVSLADAYREYASSMSAAGVSRLGGDPSKSSSSSSSGGPSSRPNNNPSRSSSGSSSSKASTSKASTPSNRAMADAYGQAARTMQEAGVRSVGGNASASQSSSGNKGDKTSYAASLADAYRQMGQTMQQAGVRSVGGNGNATASTGRADRSDPMPIAQVAYANSGAVRSQKLTSSLENSIARAVGAVYGPGYTAKVYSGGQPARGLARVGSVRHNDGKAADVYVMDPNGKRVRGDSLAPLAQYWAANRIGGVGLEMRGGGIHLDEWSTPPKGGAMTWNYASKGGSLSAAQKAALEAGVKGKMPALWSGTTPKTDRVPVQVAATERQVASRPAAATPGYNPDAPTPTPRPAGTRFVETFLGTADAQTPATAASPAQTANAAPEPSVGRQIASQMVDAGLSAVPVIGIGAGLMNAGLQIAGKPSLGTMAVDSFMNGEGPSADAYAQEYAIRNNRTGGTPVDKKSPDEVAADETSTSPYIPPTGAARVWRPTPAQKWDRSFA